jgi:hypothetical protein
VDDRGPGGACEGGGILHGGGRRRLGECGEDPVGAAVRALVGAATLSAEHHTPLGLKKQVESAYRIL